MAVVGVDIADKTFDATLYITAKRKLIAKARHFDNTVDGFDSFEEWLFE